MDCPQHTMEAIPLRARLQVADAVRKEYQPDDFLPAGWEVTGCAYCCRAELRPSGGSLGPVIVDVPAWQQSIEENP